MLSTTLMEIGDRARAVAVTPVRGQHVIVDAPWLAPDPAITEQILRRCIAVLPELAGAPVLGVEVGIRPGRPRVRLERADCGSPPVVHNYGHAGNGVMLSWGCADAATVLALG